AAPIEITPAVLVLPLVSSSGPVYTATCICRSTNGKPLDLSVASVPRGLTVELFLQGNAAMRHLRVTLDPSQPRLAVGQQRQLIRLQARAGADEAIVELPVLLP